jgi:predicted tellurium resistance membrane protein TerC
MDRFPIVITAGAALLGWIGGDMLVHDVFIKEEVERVLPVLRYVSPVAGAVLVVIIGRLASRRAVKARPAPVDLAEPAVTRDHGDRDADTADRS